MTIFRSIWYLLSLLTVIVGLGMTKGLQSLAFACLVLCTSKTMSLDHLLAREPYFISALNQPTMHVCIFTRSHRR